MANRILIPVALLFGLVTALYPFGGDQGLYYYVGREWLSGAVPYRDAMEQKTPLVFALHALLVLLTGPNMWAIRVTELAWVPLVALALAKFATPEGEPRRPGVLGIACLATSVLYFGLFNYWDTAQCEIWYAGLSLLSLGVVARRVAGWRSWSLGGFLGGLALLMKPPAALLLAVVAVVLAARAWRLAAQGGRLRSASLALLAFAAGGAVPIAVVGLYFAGVGALGHLIDQAFRANYHDMLHSSTVASVDDLVRRFADFSAKTGLLAPGTVAATLLGGGLALRRGSASHAGRYGVALALLLAGLAAVAVQRKFYGYHWGALAPLMALPWVCVAHDLSRVERRWLPAPASARLLPAALAALLAVGFASSPMADEYARIWTLAADYLAGRIGREAFLTPFVVDDNTPYAHQEVVGRWIQAHSSPADLIAVRGFDQAIYAVAHRRAPTRFFWTRWLTEPRRAYRRGEWLAEDLAALRRKPPRYVVVSQRARKGPASRAYFKRLGYAECFRHGRLIVLARGGT